MATTDKYDRQLRLWGAAGQRALAECGTVVLVGASAAGTETCKNLVLPGLGRLTVVDEEDVTTTSSDAAVNFFTPRRTDDDDGATTTTTRAATAATYLQELNPDVRITHVTVPDLDAVTDWDPVFDGVVKSQSSSSSSQSSSKRPSLVIASDVNPTVLDRLAAYCDEKTSTPLLIVRTYGLTGSVRLQAPPLPVWNPRPRNTRPDLRLADPFPTLTERCRRTFGDDDDDTTTTNTMDSQALGRIPYPLILLHCRRRYQSSHGGRMPRTVTEKRDFVDLIKETATDCADQLNFQEAASHAYLAYTPEHDKVDEDHVRNLLNKATGKDDDDFAVLLRALRRFAASHDGYPPLRGDVPDMTAGTTQYVTLQRLYRERAEEELREFIALLPRDGIDAERVTTFCQNAAHLDLVAPRSWRRECQEPVPDDVKEDLQTALMEVDVDGDGDDEGGHGQMALQMTPLWWYLGIRACQMFWKDHGRYPGVFDDDDNATNSDSDETKRLADDAAVVAEKLRYLVVQRYGLEAYRTIIPTVAAEMTRYGAAELHPVAAVVGGVAAQEAVKVITGQYTPIDHTYVYNGIASTAAVYRF